MPTLRMTNATTLMRESGESVGFMEQSGINHTVSPLGREADQLCPPTEDLKGFLGSKKTFKSGEEKAGSIDNIGKADTLPTEGFYD